MNGREVSLLSAVLSGVGGHLSQDKCGLVHGLGLAGLFFLERLLATLLPTLAAFLHPLLAFEAILLDLLLLLGRQNGFDLSLDELGTLAGLRTELLGTLLLVFGDGAVAAGLHYGPHLFANGFVRPVRLHDAADLLFLSIGQVNAAKSAHRTAPHSAHSAFAAHSFSKAVLAAAAFVTLAFLFAAVIGRLCGRCSGKTRDEHRTGCERHQFASQFHIFDLYIKYSDDFLIAFLTTIA